MDSIEIETQIQQVFKNPENISNEKSNSPMKLIAEKKNFELWKRLQKPYELKIVWFNAIGFLIGHLATMYGTYLIFTEAKVLTALWMLLTVYTSLQGVTMGAHRLYSHRSFKANKWIRFILITLQTMAGQNCAWVWIRDHRQHHKYSDTDADPHNSKRGLFFSHVGWLMVRKHPDVIIKGETIDMSDINQDAMVMFQKKHYLKLLILMGFVVPPAIPCLFWNETLWNSFFICAVARLIYSLNCIWLVNSMAHAYGTKPFNKEISPVENCFASILTFGEGWHNYHHSFPWDYRAAEFGQYLNFTTSVIDYLAKKGWVYDLKFADSMLVKQYVIKKGDGTHPVYEGFNPNGIRTTENY